MVLTWRLRDLFGWLNWVVVSAGLCGWFVGGGLVLVGFLVVFGCCL